MRVWVGLGALLTAGCLLTTSLDGLEGPPLSPDAAAPDGAMGDGPIGDGGGADEPPAADGTGVDGAPITDGGGDADFKGPFRVARAGGTLRGIAEHDTDIYWTQTDTAAGVVRASKQDGQPVFFDLAPNAFDVAVDADYVYWSTGKGNEVYRKAIGAEASSGALYFSGAGETLYLAAGGGGRVYATGLASVAAGPRGDAGTSDALYLLQSGAAGVAVSGVDLFWSLDTGIVRGGDTGQLQPQSIYRGMAGEVAGIAIDTQEIYWIGSDGVVRALSRTETGPATPREVCRGSKEAADAESDARADGAGVPSPADIAVDEQWVYFTEPPIRQISKCFKR